MNDTSTRPKRRKPIIICKDPKRAIEIMNKKYGEGRFPIGRMTPSLKNKKKLTPVIPNVK